MTRTFAVTFDYRCPYARIAHDHVHAGLSAGADWDVTFLPYCLGQSHVEDGMPDVWDRPDSDSGLLALQLAVSVRDNQPGAFLDLHHGMFQHRHVANGSLRDRDALTRVLEAAGADAGAAFDDVATGRTLSVVREEHHRFADSHGVWGVPTFIVGSAAVFVRLLDRADGDGDLARATVERILDTIGWEILNEFKHTTVPR